VSRPVKDAVFAPGLPVLSGSVKQYIRAPVPTSCHISVATATAATSTR